MFLCHFLIDETIKETIRGKIRTGESIVACPIFLHLFQYHFISTSFGNDLNKLRDSVPRFLLRRCNRWSTIL